MSRDIKITSCEKGEKNYYYREYSRMLEILGFSFNKRTWDLKVSGCGMNMLFATNYNIMRYLLNLKFINRKECAILEQKVN